MNDYKSSAQERATSNIKQKNLVNHVANKGMQRPSTKMGKTQNLKVLSQADMDSSKVKTVEHQFDSNRLKSDDGKSKDAGNFKLFMISTNISQNDLIIKLKKIVKNLEKFGAVKVHLKKEKSFTTDLDTLQKNAQSELFKLGDYTWVKLVTKDSESRWHITKKPATPQKSGDSAQAPEVQVGKEQRS